MAADPEGAPPARAREPMQRLRIGVTGLSAVTLLVLLAFSIAQGVRDERTPANAAAAAQTDASEPANAQDQEPLAQLGVAPASGDGNAQAGPNGAR